MAHDVVDRTPAAIHRLSADDASVVHEIACGRAAVILDNNAGALLFFAAEAASTALLSFAIRYSSGLIHAVMRSSRLDRLRIHDQPVLASEGCEHGFTVSVDAVGCGTGVSAQDRGRTLRLLGTPRATASDFQRPGHVLPVRCPDVLLDQRYQAWDTTIRIVESAGFMPVAAACRLVHDSGDVLDDLAAREFATTFGLPVVVPGIRRAPRFAAGA